MEKKLKNGEVAGWVILLNDSEIIANSFVHGRKAARDNMNKLKANEELKNENFRIAKLVISH